MWERVKDECLFEGKKVSKNMKYQSKSFLEYEWRYSKSRWQDIVTDFCSKKKKKENVWNNEKSEVFKKKINP